MPFLFPVHTMARGLDTVAYCNGLLGDFPWLPGDCTWLVGDCMWLLGDQGGGWMNAFGSQATACGCSGDCVTPAERVPNGPGWAGMVLRSRPAGKYKLQFYCPRDLG